MATIYLDNNASTRLDPQVAARLAECDAAGYANPASQHAEGRRARLALEQARERMAELLDAGDARVVITSGGTEANNLAIQGLARAANSLRKPTAANTMNTPRLIVSAIEHPSVLASAERLKADGWRVDLLRADSTGQVDVNHLQILLSEPADLVSVMLGNNETGVLQPLDAIAHACRERNIPLHTDAVQAVGKLPVSFRALNVAAMSVAAHKFHGPRGIGLLVLREPIEIEPVLIGGQQQLGLRPGTESVSLAVGMCAALECWRQEADQRTQRLGTLRDLLQSRLIAGDPLAVVIGQNSPRLPHTLCVSFVGLDRQVMLMALDLADVACSTGSACASGSSEPSPVLLAMGLAEPLIGSALRFSLGAETTAAEVEQAADRILRVVNDLRERMGRRISPGTAPPRAKKSL